MSYVKDLGYKVVVGLYFKVNTRGDFVLINDDSSLMQVSSHLKNGDCFEVYVDHASADKGTSEAAVQRFHL